MAAIAALIILQLVPLACSAQFEMLTSEIYIEKIEEQERESGLTLSCCMSVHIYIPTYRISVCVCVGGGDNSLYILSVKSLIQINVINQENKTLNS